MKPHLRNFSRHKQKIDYIYDAVDTKLKKLVTDGGSLTTTDISNKKIISKITRHKIYIVYF